MCAFASYKRFKQLLFFFPNLCSKPHNLLSPIQLNVILYCCSYSLHPFFLNYTLFLVSIFCSSFILFLELFQIIGLACWEGQFTLLVVHSSVHLSCCYSMREN